MKRRLIAAAAGWCAANELGWVLWDFLIRGSWWHDPVSVFIAVVLLAVLTPWHLAVSGPCGFFASMFRRHEGATWREIYEEETRACGGRSWLLTAADDYD